MVVRRLHITSIDYLGMPAQRLVLGLPSDYVLIVEGCLCAQPHGLREEHL